MIGWNEKSFFVEIFDRLIYILFTFTMDMTLKTDSQYIFCLPNYKCLILESLIFIYSYLAYGTRKNNFTVDTWYTKKKKISHICVIQFETSRYYQFYFQLIEYKCDYTKKHY